MSMERSGPKTWLGHFVVNSGDTISDVQHIGTAVYASIFLPTVDSCAMYLRAAPTHTGSYNRVQNAAGSGDQSYAAAAGNVVYSLPQRFTALDHVKLEFSVAQTDTRTIPFIVGI